MHNVGHYLGVLSDINLGPKRTNVRFFVPDTIRTTRRRYYLAAMLIQTCFRCWIESRVYLRKKRLLILAQSIVRMWPKWKIFLRLRKHTIRSQVLLLHLSYSFVVVVVVMYGVE
jgi:hypothetical protein